MTRAKTTIVDLLLIACRATPSLVDPDVAAGLGFITDEGAGGTYELVGSRREVVLLESRDRRLVGPIWAVPPHILFE